MGILLFLKNVDLEMLLEMLFRDDEAVIFRKKHRRIIIYC